MIITKEVEIALSNSNINYFESLGYPIPRTKDKWGKFGVPRGTKIIVKTEHLQPTSKCVVEFQCDYCCFERGFRRIVEIMKGRKIVNKDCCEKCRREKIKETNLIKYGVEYTTQLESTKNKAKETNLKVFGTEFAIQNPEIKAKRENTYIDRFGEIINLKNSKVKEKMIQNNLIKYGTEYPSMNEDVKKKVKETNLIRYGVENASQNKQIRSKQMKSMYENKTAPSSRQQKYIHNLFGGELNFPCGNAFLDVAFVDERIYLEYDGGGHDLEVKFGDISEEEHKKKERKRWYALYRKGWKEIRIISIKDKLPTDKKLIEMLNYAKEYLSTGRHYIKFDLDNNKIITSQFVKEHDFGKLRKIYKKDIESMIDNAI